MNQISMQNVRYFFSVRNMMDQVIQISENALWFYGFIH